MSLSSKLPSRLSSTHRRVGTAAIALAVAGVLGLAGTASANFSPYEPPYRYTWYDCNIWVGPGYDTARAGQANWRYLGAGQVDCSRYHWQIAITVRQYRSINGVPTEVGTASWSSTSGYTSGFTQTGPACRNGQPARWQTRVYVTLDGHTSGWLSNLWSSTRTDGCAYL